MNLRPESSLTNETDPSGMTEVERVFFRPGGLTGASQVNRSTRPVTLEMLTDAWEQLVLPGFDRDSLTLRISNGSTSN